MKTTFIVLLSLLSLAGAGQEKIITAGSSSSEIICQLGLCDKIIATDRTSLYPERLQALPSIGYRTGISAEGIIALKPDLVIFEKEYVKDEVITQLKATGIAVLVVINEQSIESTKNRIRTIAAQVKKVKEGEVMVQQIESSMASVQKKIASVTSRPSVLGVYARGAGSMMVAGQNTSFGILPFSGVVNAAGAIEGYKPLNTESLIQANPDYILFFTTGLESLGGIDGVLKIPGVAQTTAGKKKQIVAMDGVLLTNWGPRVAQAVEELFFLTHPEVKK